MYILLGSRAPTSIIRLPDPGFNARSMHISLGGEWDYDLALKSRPGPPIRTGWLRAILVGHQKVAAGLAIGVPILVLASTTTDFSPDVLRFDLDEATAQISRAISLSSSLSSSSSSFPSVSTPAQLARDPGGDLRNAGRRGGAGDRLLMF